MSWDDIMRRMLPPIGGVLPHITGPAGAFGAGEAEGRGPVHRGLTRVWMSIMSVGKARSIKAVQSYTHP
jgi:hypothetical protein